MILLGGQMMRHVEAAKFGYIIILQDHVFALGFECIGSPRSARPSR